MNILKGKITNIESKGNISLVHCAIENQTLQAVVIGNTSTMHYLIMDNEIELLINESEVAIAKNIHGLFSISNQISGIVESIKNGYFFSRIRLNIEGQIIHSLINTNSCKNMSLIQGDKVTVFIKSNEIFLKNKD